MVNSLTVALKRWLCTLITYNGGRASRVPVGGSEEKSECRMAFIIDCRMMVIVVD
jgi:hypothetical protein